MYYIARVTGSPVTAIAVAVAKKYLQDIYK